MRPVAWFHAQVVAHRPGVEASGATGFCHKPRAGRLSARLAFSAPATLCTRRTRRLDAEPIAARVLGTRTASGRRGGPMAGTAAARRRCTARGPRRVRARGAQVWPRRAAAEGGMATPCRGPGAPSCQVWGRRGGCPRHRRHATRVIRCAHPTPTVNRRCDACLFVLKLHRHMNRICAPSAHVDLRPSANRRLAAHFQPFALPECGRSTTASPRSDPAAPFTSPA